MNKYNTWDMTPELLRLKETRFAIDEASKWREKGWIVEMWRPKTRKNLSPGGQIYHPLGGWLHLLRVNPKTGYFRHVVADLRWGRKRWKTSMSTTRGLKYSGCKRRVERIMKEVKRENK